MTDHDETVAGVHAFFDGMCEQFANLDEGEPIVLTREEGKLARVLDGGEHPIFRDGKFFGRRVVVETDKMRREREFPKDEIARVLNDLLAGYPAVVRVDEDGPLIEYDPYAGTPFVEYRATVLCEGREVALAWTPGCAVIDGRYRSFADNRVTQKAMDELPLPSLATLIAFHLAGEFWKAKYETAKEKTK